MSGVGGLANQLMDHIDPEKSVALAAIIGAHGISGEVRLKLFTDDLDGLLAHKRFNHGTLTLKSVKRHKLGAIGRFAEITDRNAAEAARGTELTVLRADLPPLAEDEYYHIDIIGLNCVSSDGEDLGKIVATYDFGAGDVIEIERHNGKKFMVPAKAIDLSVDPAVIDSLFVE